jgi:cell division protein FtsB
MYVLNTKKLMLRVFFCCEVFIMALCYCGGMHGITFVMRMKQKHTMLENDIATLYKNIENLSMDIENWAASSFCQEKIAREQLHMARPDDVIFLIT